jgi:hypothetical protein
MDDVRAGKRLSQCRPTDPSSIAERRGRRDADRSVARGHPFGFRGDDEGVDPLSAQEASFRVGDSPDPAHLGRGDAGKMGHAHVCTVSDPDVRVEIRD